MKVKLLFLITITAVINSCSNIGIEKTFTASLLKGFDKNSSLIDRVDNVPDLILNYWREVDNRSDYRLYNLDKEDLKLIGDNLNLLPQTYTKELESTLVGIYFIENFWGSGLTDFIISNKGEIYTYIIINPKLLDMTIDEVMAWKENTSFKKNNSYRAEFNISKEHSALLYILLHETTHSIDYTKGLTPYTSREFSQHCEISRESKIVKSVWEDYNIKTKTYDLDIFKYITFYGFNNGPKLDYYDSTLLYNSLLKTPFISTYSTLSWAEDIAELYTVSYLVRELNCNYILSIYKDDILVFEKDLYNRDLIKSRADSIVFN